MFYDRSGGLPSGWIGMVKHNLVTLGPVVLAGRMVRQYTEDYYLPAAERSWRLQEHGFAGARDLAAWKERVTAAWSGVMIREVSSGQQERSLGSRLTVRAVVELGALEPEDVEVQVAYGPVDDADELPDVDILPLKQDGHVDEGGWAFEGEVPLLTPGAFGYTVRVVPRHQSLIGPAELGLVAWASEG
jgi:glycogen phosphorylase